MSTIIDYPPPLGDRRITALDIARLFGMVLVYYGHAIEQVMYLGNATAAQQYKFIYSFHMPFFFLVAGYVAKSEKLELGAGAFFKRLAASRLIPYFFFSLVFMVASMFVPGTFALSDLTSVQGYLAGMARTLLGMPVYNIPMWFLASLVSVEALHYLAGRHLRTDVRIAIAAACFYLLGYYLNLHFQFLQFDKIFRWNYWFIHQAPVGYAFYLAGVLLRRRGLFYEDREPARGGGPWSYLAGGLACL
ncbi:MAG: acyltransferase family protein, partial [Oceanidesulfovibrio sp.]